MLLKNNLTKYFVYASGEIILVVIGILLALQINTWNQNRINNSKENVYYERFLDDVLLDEKILTKQIEATKDRLQGANILLNVLQSGDDDMDKVAQAIIRSVSKSDFGLRPTQTTFEDIKSSGNINLIKDIRIRRELDDYYAFMLGLMTTINNNAAGLGPRMSSKDQLLGTGLFTIAKFQNAFDLDMVDVEELETLSILTEENKMKLLNDAIYYAGISSRNLVHFETLQKKVAEMKMILETKCN